MRDLVEAYLVDGHKLGHAVQLARPGRPVQRRVARGVRLVHRHPVTGAENICIMVKNNITSEPETLPHELQVAALGGVVQRARAALATRRLHLDRLIVTLSTLLLYRVSTAHHVAGDETLRATAPRPPPVRVRAARKIDIYRIDIKEI